MNDDDDGWVITKATRGYRYGLGYSGPSWEAAGRKPPTRALTLREAEILVEVLNRVNGCGWTIHRYVTYEEYERKYQSRTGQGALL